VLGFISHAEACFWRAERLRGTGRASVGIVLQRNCGRNGGYGFGFANGAELLHFTQDRLEILQGNAIREIAGCGGWTAVSKLCLDRTKIVRRVPDIFRESAAQIVDAELGANSGALLQGFPLFGETRRRAGLRAWAMRAEQVDDGLLTVNAWREFLDDFRDGGADRERLVHVALGVEGQCAEVGIVIRCADAGGGAVTESEIGAEQQEKTEARAGSLEQLPAFFIGGDGCARLGLMDARDGVADCERGDADPLQPAEKSAQTLRVRRTRVLRELRRLPCRRGALDVIGGELRGRQLAEVG
jgi:hypothetical protein